MSFKFTDYQNSKFEKADLHTLGKAFNQLVDMELDYEEKLNTIREIKARVLIEIEIKNKKRK